MPDRKSYDPNVTPRIPLQDFEEAGRLGLIPVVIHCRGEDEETALSFSAHVYAIPRVGERIVLENGAAAEVTRVYHTAFHGGKNGFYSLAVNIAAQLLEEEQDDEYEY